MNMTYETIGTGRGDGHEIMRFHPFWHWLWEFIPDKFPKRLFGMDDTVSLEWTIWKIIKGIEAMYLDKIDGRIGEKSYDRKSAEWEKGRVLNFLLWNSIWKDRCLHPNYRQPFRVLRKIH